jgi:hypothetical protein
MKGKKLASVYSKILLFVGAFSVLGRMPSTPEPGLTLQATTCGPTRETGVHRLPGIYTTYSRQGIGRLSLTTLGKNGTSTIRLNCQKVLERLPSKILPVPITCVQLRVDTSRFLQGVS